MIRGKKRQTGKREAESTTFMRHAKGIAITLAMIFVMLCICAVLVSGAVIPENALNGCVLLSCALGVVTGTSATVRGRGNHTILQGAGIGIAIAAIFAVSGLLLYSSIDVFSGGTIIAACVFGGCIAGLIKGERRGARRDQTKVYKM